MTGSRWRAAGVVAAVLSCAAGCARGPAVQSTLALRRVVIYRNGVGYFERRGRVREDFVEFRVRRAEVGDFLATLAVVGPGRSPVLSAAFPAREEPATASPSSEERRTVRLQLNGGGHDLSVGYMTETPIWRPSYRLVFTDQGGVQLQAWGIVQNTTDEDWTGVRLTLASGAAVAFRSQLDQPVTASRPLVTDQGDLVAVVPRPGTTLATETDRDGDAILDETDRCPDVPEDRDSLEDTDGCPDADVDNDRVLDARDRCPNAAETYNGFEDDDGCPDTGHLALMGNAIDVRAQVGFEADGARSSAGGGDAIEQMARLMRANPQITRLLVEGHADADEARRAPGGPRALGRERAEAVVRALIERGVEAARLESTSVGSARPLDTARTAAARARNRRVEFRVLAQGAPREAAGAPGGGASSAATQPAGSSAAARPGARLVALTAQGGTSRFELPEPVNVPRHSATMVPLATRVLPGERMYLYAPEPGVAGSSVHPFEVARFQNRSGALLERGPLTIYDSRALLGQGLLDALPEGATATVPFALERAVNVDVTTGEGTEGARLVGIEGPRVTLERFHVARATYRVRSGVDRAVRVMARHAINPGWRLHEPPAGTEETEDSALVPVHVAARGRAELAVQTRAPFTVVTTWLDELAASAVEDYLRSPRAPAAPAATALRTALDLRRQYIARERDRDAVVQRRSDVARSSSETRANLLSLERTPRAADLRAQLTARLARTSAEIDEADRRLVEIDTDLSELRVRLDEAVRALRVNAGAGAPAAAP